MACRGPPSHSVLTWPFLCEGQPGCLHFIFYKDTSPMGLGLYPGGIVLTITFWKVPSPNTVAWIKTHPYDLI